MGNPSKIVEGSIEFSLGKFDGKLMVYDFPKILVYLAAKGKMMFGNHFKIYPEDEKILFLLSNYFIKDEKNCKKYNIDPSKGILISGPVGCGKTSLMRLVKNIVPHLRQYEVIPARNIVFGFNHIGFKTIEDYGNEGYFCFDDLGAEPTGRYFGKDCNVMGELLISRHEYFLQSKIKTHATTNLIAEEMEGRYGSRVRSRMRQMFNLVYFDKKTRDKRK